MAQSFTLKSPSYDGRYIEVTCKQTKNISTNTSDIEWILTVAGGSAGSYSTGPVTLLINGKQVFYSARKSYSTRTFPAAKGSASGKITVAHNDADGSCTVPVSLTTAIYTTTLSETKGDWVLDSIDRISTVSAGDAFIGSRSTVVVNRKNDSFRHSLSYAFGALSGFIDADGLAVAQEVKLSATTINFFLPEDFYMQIPDDPSGTCVLTCKTYSGENVIGQASAEFTVTANPARCAPVVTGEVVDINENTLALTGDPGKLIRFASTARCTIVTQAQNGATIEETKIGGRVVTESTADFEDVSFEKVLFQATDSRGYSSSFEADSNAFELIPYVMLTNNAAVQRTDPTSGNAVLTLDGNCWNGNFGAAENSLEVRYQVNDGEPVSLQLLPDESHKYTAQIGIEGLDYTRSHQLQVTVEDSVTSVTKTLTVQKGIPVFDWGESDFRFNVPVALPGLTIEGMSLAEYIRSIVEGS